MMLCTDFRMFEISDLVLKVKSELWFSVFEGRGVPKSGSYQVGCSVFILNLMSSPQPPSPHPSACIKSFLFAHLKDEIETR